MLKLKKGIRIEILEKYGFEKRYDEETGKVKYYHNKEWNYNVDVKERTFIPNQKKYTLNQLSTINRFIGSLPYNPYENKNMWTERDFNYLYDLIKDDIVEKIEIE